MHKSDRKLILHIETGGMTTEEEDRLVNSIMRVISKHSIANAHVEVPLHIEGHYD